MMQRRETGTARRNLRTVLRRTYLGVSLFSVSVVGISLTVLAMLALRSSADYSLHMIARSMGYTVEAAVVFHDPVAASQAVARQAGDEQNEIAEVVVSDSRGEPMTVWHRDRQETPLQSLAVRSTRWLLPAPIVLPIMHDHVRVGELRVVGYGGRLSEFLLNGLFWILLCLLVSALGALYLSRKMLREIIHPLRGLAQVTHAIRRERAFERRVPHTRIIELNELGNDFNGLLDELEAWERGMQRENAELTHQATRDDLTTLPKRTLFDTYLRQVTENAAPSEHVALLFIDLDRFKVINDSFGHAAGDAALVGVASRIRAQLREGDMAARLGGDEFAVLLVSLRSVDDAVDIARRMLVGMQAPFTLADGQQIPVSISIGIAVLPDHADDAETLMQAADAAMYHAKHQLGGDWQMALAVRTPALDETTHS
ncbi:diguanylate cyclase [Rhodanobacter sp. C01]|uniref:diguanylate cyclase domain-containing protein n=1 Tax=Rhodanobacter sp. C01 TaxID=1945856 RepID=UPI0009871D0B|nr:diguanylate cyclase [Rhodanobacter sp. C01]